MTAAPASAPGAGAAAQHAAAAVARAAGPRAPNPALLFDVLQEDDDSKRLQKLIRASIGGSSRVKREWARRWACHAASTSPLIWGVQRSGFWLGGSARQDRVMGPRLCGAVAPREAGAPGPRVTSPGGRCHGFIHTVPFASPAAAQTSRPHPARGRAAPAAPAAARPAATRRRCAAARRPAAAIRAHPPATAHPRCLRTCLLHLCSS
jgi:hypothetical protein